MTTIYNISLYNISNEDWETMFNDCPEYEFKDSHNYLKGTLKTSDGEGLDILRCIDCGADSLFDKQKFKSCEERNMHKALE